MASSATVTKTPKQRRGAGANKAGETDMTGPPAHDFFWTYTEEPHRTRRNAIIKAHPEVGAYPGGGALGQRTPGQRY